MKERVLCDDECESVSHVLWECPGFEHFQSLDSFRKASFILCSELWEDNEQFRTNAEAIVVVAIHTQCICCSCELAPNGTQHRRQVYLQSYVGLPLCYERASGNAPW